MPESTTESSDLNAATEPVEVVVPAVPAPAAAASDGPTEAHVPAAAPSEPALPPRLRVIAMINQKGGVGKTTTVANVGAALARMGRRVLLIDLDPQSHLTLHLGLDPGNLAETTYHLLTDDDMTAEQVVQSVGDNLAILPAEMNLAGIEAELAPKMITGRAQRILKDKCATLLGQGPADDGQASVPPPGGPLTASPVSEPAPPVPPAAALFDYVLIDCPPSLGLLTINALVMAREVIVPMQAHFLALQGFSKLLETVSIVRQSFNPELLVSGVVLCMFEGQTVLAGEVLADLTAFLDAHRQLDVPWRDAQVLRPPVRRNIKLAECPSFGQSIFDYEAHCRGAEDYRALAEALAAQRVAT